MPRIVKIGVYSTFALGAINIVFSLTGFLTLQLNITNSNTVPPSLTLIGKSQSLSALPSYSNLSLSGPVARCKADCLPWLLSPRALELY